MVPPYGCRMSASRGRRHASAPPRRAHEHRQRSSVVVALVLVVGVIVGVGSPAWPPGASSDDDGDERARRHHPSRARTRRGARRTHGELAKYYEQELDWRELRVQRVHPARGAPRLRATPTARRIELAVLRVPAARRGERVGQLVVNPGGPAGSGVDYAASGSFSLRRAADRATTTSSASTRAASGRARRWSALGTEQTDEFLGVRP